MSTKKKISYNNIIVDDSLESDIINEITMEYYKLNEKCDKVIERIRKRKHKNK